MHQRVPPARRPPAAQRPQSLRGAASGILALQRLAGNRAVGRLLQRAKGDAHRGVVEDHNGFVEIKTIGGVGWFSAPSAVTGVGPDLALPLGTLVRFVEGEHRTAESIEAIGQPAGRSYQPPPRTRVATNLTSLGKIRDELNEDLRTRRQHFQFGGAFSEGGDPRDRYILTNLDLDDPQGPLPPYMTHARAGHDGAWEMKTVNRSHPNEPHAWKPGECSHLHRGWARPGP